MGKQSLKCRRNLLKIREKSHRCENEEHGGLLKTGVF